MTYRLRYLDRTLELGPTPITVGRNSTCQLTIDSDALISRRHATFRVTPKGVIVEDHESRNGVIVNGARIEKEALILPGDTILIGVQNFTLLGDKARGKAKTPKDLAATGLHRIVPSNDVVPASSTQVDYVTIAGQPYAVIPKAEYLRMRKELAAATPASPSARRAAPRASKAKKK